MPPREMTAMSVVPHTDVHDQVAAGLGDGQAGANCRCQDIRLWTERDVERVRKYEANYPKGRGRKKEGLQPQKPV